MDGCKGMPYNGAYMKACPERDRCARYKLHLSNPASKPSGYHAMQGPYDFEDEECGQFLER